MSTRQLVFSTPTLLDLDAIRVMGLNAKLNDNAIGYFGTGLKYAIAVLLREGHKVEILIDGHKTEFHTTRKDFRQKNFDIVKMNDETLGYTTELGKNWKLWMAFRELYSNTLDEDGEIQYINFDSVIKPSQQKEKTHIIIHDRFSKLSDLYQTRNEIIKTDEPFLRLDGVDVYQGRSEYLYYKGIKAGRLSEESRFTYSIQKDLELTEDRTIKDLFRATIRIENAIAQTDNQPFLFEVLKASAYFEKKLDFVGTTLGKTFIDTVISLKGNSDLLPYAWKAVKNATTENAVYGDPIKLQNDDDKLLRQAIDICLSFNYRVDEYPIKIYEALDRNAMGMAKDGTIYISYVAFESGIDELVKTLFEEWVHLKYGYRDESRALQNYLINQVVKMGYRLKSCREDHASLQRKN